MAELLHLSPEEATAVRLSLRDAGALRLTVISIAVPERKNVTVNLNTPRR